MKIASVEPPPQPSRYMLVSVFSSFGKYVARGIAFTETLTPTCAHMAASAWQIFSSLI